MAETETAVRPGWLQPPVLGDGDQILVADFWTNNARMIEDTARLYWPTPADSVEVLDATIGRRRGFWTDRMWEAYKPTTNDADKAVTADYHYPFQDFPDEWGDRFDVVLYDPDYTTKGRRVGTGFDEMNRTYGLIRSPKNVAEMTVNNQVGVTECARVTKPGGLLLVKYADQVDSGRHVDGVFAMGLAARQAGLKEIRRLMFLRRQPTPQPKRRNGSGWSRQRNAAQNTSELLIFRKHTKRETRK